MVDAEIYSIYRDIKDGTFMIRDSSRAEIQKDQQTAIFIELEKILNNKTTIEIYTTKGCGQSLYYTHQCIITPAFHTNRSHYGSSYVIGYGANMGEAMAKARENLGIVRTMTCQCHCGRLVKD